MKINIKYLKALIIASCGLSFGMLALIPNVSHGGPAYQQGYEDGRRAGSSAARDDAPPDDLQNQNSGSACCGGQQQQQPQQQNSNTR